jgi:hypothetical protein
VDTTLSSPSLLHSLRRAITGIIIPACFVGFAAVGARAATAAPSRVSLTEAPLVMRLSKDQFRVAVGINGEQCFPHGCRGAIRYRVLWRTEDGVTRSAIREVSYAVEPNSHRSIAVDRQYLDTAEGEHTTSVVSVSVDVITCRPRVEPRAS